MKNREKWAAELIECALSADATGLKNGRPVICTKLHCSECDMSEVCQMQGGDACAAFLHEWAEQEAEE